MSGLLIKLISAHLAGDFLFQPAKWVENRQAHKIKSPYLYAHTGVHALLLLIVLQFDFRYAPGMLVIVLSHFLLDLAKAYAEGKIDGRILFFTDQLLHLSIILGVVKYYEPSFKLVPDNWNGDRIWLFLAFLLLLTVVSSTVIKLLLAPFKTGEPATNRAGKYIGMLERLFVFFFILANYWEGIGFLLAAKSVFRFGDLTKAKDRELTEYMLIGTLLSFGMAMGLAVGYLYLVSG